MRAACALIVALFAASCAPVCDNPIGERCAVWTSPGCTIDEPCCVPECITDEEYAEGPGQVCDCSYPPEGPSPYPGNCVKTSTGECAWEAVP